MARRVQHQLTVGPAGRHPPAGGCGAVRDREQGTARGARNRHALAVPDHALGNAAACGGLVVEGVVAGEDFGGQESLVVHFTRRSGRVAGCVVLRPFSSPGVQSKSIFSASMRRAV
ncbi:hypothetical protein GCM10010425_75820 [Streptomyces spororaveus]|uniref:Uncharacterized protein n=1 Tax=Streptomyces spororaveus TaxID=284039 RepID=A0ABQ3T3M3_9ACTN|nr:hypothetical protein Sspor_05380 [Streptomyces spororaveus]